MADPIFPYETRLNILYQPLELIDIPKFAETVDFKWFNQTLCKVNDQDDEFFYVVSGRLLIDLQDRIVELSPGQAFVVPRSVVHRTRAPERTVILMVENAGIIPTGDP